MTPFDPTRHRSIRDLPRDVALVFAIVIVLILVSAFAGKAETRPADPFAEYVRHQQQLIRQHPGHWQIKAYVGQVPHGNGFRIVRGMQTRVTGHGIFAPCWYTAWEQGQGLVGGSCRGN